MSDAVLPLAEVAEVLTGWVLDPHSTYRRADGAPIYTRVLAGAQGADHPSFEQIARHSPGHFLPRPVFARAHPDAPAAREGDLSVLSFAFVMNPATVAENAARDDGRPCLGWYETRGQWDAFYPETARRLVAWLAMRGLPAVCPPLDAPDFWFSYGVDRPHGSAWSERHVGWACGLGTFGLQGAFITDAGCCVRLMSVVVDGSVREGYADPEDNVFGGCLHLNGTTCAACAARCPSGGVTPTGRGIDACREYVAENTAWGASAYGWRKPACGLCMTRVPCALTRPRARER